MECALEFVRQDGDRYLHRCPKCKADVRSKYADPSKRKQDCAKAPKHGPGTELLRLFAELHVKPTKNCGCKKYAKKMDGWGVAGCRERRDEIVEHLKTESEKFGLSAWAAAGWQALVKGLPMTLAGLVDLAIERAASHAQ